MSIPVNPKVDDKFKECMNLNYDKHSEVNSNIEKVHEYLGITFYFTWKGMLKINTGNYVEIIINEFPMKISNSDTYLTPDGNNIFGKGNRIIIGKKETK